MKPIDNKPKTKREEYNRDMDGLARNPYLLQEPQHFNKPSKLIKQVIDTPLTLRQKKMYSYFLRELLQQDNKNNEIKISLQDLFDFLKTTRETYQDDLKKLQKSIITIEEDDKFITNAVLISSYTEPKNQDKKFDLFKNLTIRFDTRLTEVLKEIYSYAKLDLRVIRDLKITHSLTLYEIFKRRLIKKSAGKINLTEQDIRKYLNLENKYLDIKDFNKQLKRWVKDIEDNSQMSINYTKRKIKKVNIYYFFVSDVVLIPFNDFKKKILRIKQIENLIFTYKKRKYFLIDIQGEDKLLIQDYEKYMKFQTPENLKVWDKRFTLPKPEAWEMWEDLHAQYLDNSLVFCYKFFILNDMDISIKKLNDAELSEVQEEKLNSYFDNFLR